MTQKLKTWDRLHWNTLQFDWISKSKRQLISRFRCNYCATAILNVRGKEHDKKNSDSTNFVLTMQKVKENKSHMRRWAHIQCTNVPSDQQSQFGPWRPMACRGGAGDWLPPHHLQLAKNQAKQKGPSNRQSDRVSYVWWDDEQTNKLVSEPFYNHGSTCPERAPHQRTVTTLGRAVILFCARQIVSLCVPGAAEPHPSSNLLLTFGAYRWCRFSDNVVDELQLSILPHRLQSWICMLLLHHLVL